MPLPPCSYTPRLDFGTTSRKTFVWHPPFGPVAVTARSAAYWLHKNLMSLTILDKVNLQPHDGSSKTATNLDDEMAASYQKIFLSADLAKVQISEESNPNSMATEMDCTSVRSWCNFSSLRTGIAGCRTDLKSHCHHHGRLGASS